MTESRYGLALDEARRAFDGQAADIARVRDRTVSILGVGGLSASFLGGLAIRDGAAVGGWTWAAAASFALLAGVSVWILWPRKMKVAMDSGTLVAWAEGDAGQGDMDRDLALRLAAFYEYNRVRHARMTVAYCAGMVLLVAQISFQLLDLRSR